MADRGFIDQGDGGFFGGQVAQQLPPSLLQMAQGEAPATTDTTDWGALAEPYIKQYLGGNTLDEYKAGQASGQFAQGPLAAWTDKNNWGPPPAAPEGLSANFGWFPEMFSSKNRDPRSDRFWSMASYLSQLPGGQQLAGLMDQRPNTTNWRLLGNRDNSVGGPGQPGDFMVRGTHINRDKLFYDTHRPVSEPEASGVPGGSFLPYKGWGSEASGWSTQGQVGFPGQLNPFGTSWGAAGPGSD